MIVSFAILFGALGYLYYKSKEEVSLVQNESLDSKIQKEDNDSDLDDLFI